MYGYIEHGVNAHLSGGAGLSMGLSTTVRKRVGSNATGLAFHTAAP